MLTLYPHQDESDSDIHEEWDAGATNVLAVKPTGSGKTVIFSNVLHKHKGLSVAMAHRQELVGQISMAMGRFETPHRLICPPPVVRWINYLHMEEFGRSFIQQNAPAAVAGVDTIISWARNKKHSPWLNQWRQQVTKWVMDEAHHILIANKWGSAVNLFPNALGLGVTATPLRADGKGLGRHADGVFDTMIEGPTLRWLINNDFLSDYDIALPESDLDLVGLNVTASGDYSQKKLTERVKKSHLIGDIVKEYAKHARGRLAVVFMESIETAGLVCAKFVSSGIRAAVVSSKNTDAERVQTVRRFAARELDVLINVDLFGEGYDLPAIEVVIMGRATQSYGLYVQQFGRALRKMDGKGKALIIDHVGNVLRHGLPDSPKAWSLDAREKRSHKKFDEDEIPLKRCDECTRPYEAVLIACPYCHAEPKPMGITKIRQVDGDLFLLDPATLAQMRGEVERIDESPASVMQRVFHAAGTGASIIARDRHAQRQKAQGALRAAISWWAGFQVKQDRCQREAQRRFFYRYGINPVSARALGTEDAHKLKDVIIRDLQERRV